ncbi:MAG: pyridoxal phosphate-dependent aminotransferase [Dermatophilaceae bacterium]
MSLNEHYAPPSPSVREALHGLDPMRLVTYDIEMTDTLRSRIAEREGVSIGNVLLCAGSSSGLQLLFSCLRDGTVLLPSICWTYYLNLIRLHGLAVETYDIAEGEHNFHVDLASVSGAVHRHDPTLTLFINPHMPTGSLVSAEAIAAEATREPEMLVLVDEAYHGFSRDAESLASVVPDRPNLVVSRTLSKFFGLAGIRLGYLIAHEDVVDELSKAAPPFSVPTVSARLAMAAFESESYYRRIGDELTTVRESFVARLSTIPGIRPYRSHANFVLVELESVERAHRAEQDIQAAGLKVRSAGSYGLPQFLRITVGTEDAMECVTAALEKDVS